MLGGLHRRLDDVPPPAGATGRVLHLDLHPGNVLCTPDGPVVIDWCNAEVGEGAIDLATTWLLLAVGRPEGGRAIQVLAAILRRRRSAGSVKRVAQGFLARDPREVAPELLGKVLAHDTPQGRRSGRIVEVEAYCGPIDTGAHTYRGRTARNATMFGPAGLLYVYFTYGMHWCVNVVCGDEDEGVAVLVRALAPLEGVEAMRTARGPAAKRDRDLCSGPAKLAQALGLHGDHDGADLLAGGPVGLFDDGTPPPEEPVQATRIGLSAGAEHPWRWYVHGDPNVSRR